MLSNIFYCPEWESNLIFTVHQSSAIRHEDEGKQLKK